MENKTHILSLERPSLDRICNSKNYTIDNIQVIELTENVLKDKLILNHQDGFGRCSICKERKISEEFAKCNQRISGRSSICKKCDNNRRKKTVSEVGKMLINNKFNIGDRVMTFHQRKGVVTSVSVNEFDDVKYRILHPDTNEEKWYLENHLNILIGDVYLTE